MDVFEEPVGFFRTVWISSTVMYQVNKLLTSFLLYKPGILFLFLSVIALLYPPSKLG